MINYLYIDLFQIWDMLIYYRIEMTVIKEWSYMNIKACIILQYNIK